MKRITIYLAVVLMVFILWCGQDNEAKAGTLHTRGVWVSCFEFEKCGLTDKTENVFRKNVNKMFARIKASGCNTVYFHVRAYDDAIYPSRITGFSKYLSTSGKLPAYDPLQIIVSSAHRYGLKIHAWMNPYRLTSKKVLNPSKTATINRIVSQVKEIINGYAVDGIHFDDYFYPTNEKKYSKVSKKTKKENVNTMIREVYRTIKAKKKTLQFGISPAGNIQYCEKIGADVKTWLSVPGYVDYLVPQIYWSDKYWENGKVVKMFSKRLAEWQSINKSDVPMYIGLALYKAGTTLPEDRGFGISSSNIAKQIKKIRKVNVEGYVLFSYTSLYSTEAAKELKHYLQCIGKITLNKKKKTIRAGKKFKLKAKKWPSQIKNVKWRSSNKKIATVSKKGMVKAKRKGKVKIYAYYGKLKKSCLVVVKKKKKKK